MGYELTLTLKRGSIEIEFDTLDEMEEKLAALDVPRIEKAVAAAFRARKGAGKKRAKPKTKRASAKRA